MVPFNGGKVTVLVVLEETSVFTSTPMWLSFGSHEFWNVSNSTATKAVEAGIIFDGKPVRKNAMPSPGVDPPSPIAKVKLVLKLAMAPEASWKGTGWAYDTRPAQLLLTTPLESAAQVRSMRWMVAVALPSRRRSPDLRKLDGLESEKLKLKENGG
nr:unnamed protein product [Digitaria exilis]